MKKLKPDMKFSKPKLNLFADLPEITGPIIKLCGNREVSVDGCRSVVDYYDDRIKLSISGGAVTFFGTDLKITTLTDSSATIKGKLNNVEFAVRNGTHDS